MHKIFFYNIVYYTPLHVSSTMRLSSGGQIVLHSIWYHHIESSEILCIKLINC